MVGAASRAAPRPASARRAYSTTALERNMISLGHQYGLGLNLIASGLPVGARLRLSIAVEIHGAGAKLISPGGHIVERHGPGDDAETQRPILRLTRARIKTPHVAWPHAFG